MNICIKWSSSSHFIIISQEEADIVLLMKLPEEFDPDNKMAENYSSSRDCGRKGLCIDWMHLQPLEWWEYEDSINREYMQRRACGDRTALKMSMYEFQVWKRAVLRSNMPEWYHLANIDMPPPRLMITSREITRSDHENSNEEVIEDEHPEDLLFKNKK